MRFRNGATLQWRAYNEKVFYNAVISAMSEDSIFLSFKEKPFRIPMPGEDIVIRSGIDDYYTGVMEAKPDGIRLKPIWSEQRRFFRVDDSFPIYIRKKDSSSPYVKSSVFPVYGIEFREMGLPDPDEGINIRLWKALNSINSKLSMILYSIEIQEIAVPTESENPAFWKMMEAVDAGLTHITKELKIDPSKIMQAENRKVNLSASGVSFTISEAIDPGSSVELKLLLPTSPPLGIISVAKVVRTIKNEDGSFNIAFDYADMDEGVRDELIKYVLNRQREMIRTRREIRG